MATDAQLRMRMAQERLAKEEADKSGNDRRGAYREMLQAEMDNPQRFTKRKLDAIKKGALSAAGVLTAPLDVIAETDQDYRQRKAEGRGQDNIESFGKGFSAAGKNLKSAVGGVKEAIQDYKLASEDQEAVEREAKAERRRETRGMQKGGMVSASRRADGCAQRGKTKGRIV